MTAGVAAPATSASDAPTREVNLGLPRPPLTGASPHRGDAAISRAQRDEWSSSFASGSDSMLNLPAQPADAAVAGPVIIACIALPSTGAMNLDHSIVMCDLS